jgi:hypothetical protein
VDFTLENRGPRGVSAEETFHPLEQWDGEAIMKLFRRALLERLVANRAIARLSLVFRTGNDVNAHGAVLS